jgi:hypothetical protein
MQLPEDLRQHLAEQLRFAADRLVSSDDLATKLYFLSAFYAEAQRGFNRAWSRELCIMHLVVQAAYLNLNARVQQVASGADRVVGIPADVLPALDSIASDIAGLFSVANPDENRLYRLLERLAELSYVAGGNGHYIWLKGQIDLAAT